MARITLEDYVQSVEPGDSLAWQLVAGIENEGFDYALTNYYGTTHTSEVDEQLGKIHQYYLSVVEQFNARLLQVLMEEDAS